MNNRRSALDAFKSTPEIDAFIKTGVPANDVKPERIEKAKPQDREAEPSGAAAEITEAAPKRRKKPASRTIQTGDREMHRVHSKARIQKSIRFLPDLIVELENHLRSLPPEDEQSLQTIMNDALRMWLSKNVR